MKNIFCLLNIHNFGHWCGNQWPIGNEYISFEKCKRCGKSNPEYIKPFKSKKYKKFSKG